MRRFLQSSMILTCMLFGSLIVQADLRLVCDIDGKSYAPVAINNSVIEVRSGDDVREAASSAAWRLEGDLRANAGLLLLSPTYSLFRKNFRDGQSDEGYPMRAVAGIGHITENPVTKEKRDSEILEQWPDGISNDRALIVIVWMIDGRATDVRVRIAPSTSANEFTIKETFKLTPEQSAGQPVILLWQNGRFIPPDLGRWKGLDSKALEAVIFDDAESLRALLAKGVKPTGVTKKRGITLLHLAAEANSVHAMDVLIKAAPRLVKTESKNAVNTVTPLEWAIDKGRVEAVGRLLRAKAALNRRITTSHDFTVTPLIGAVVCQHHDIVKQLLDAGADPFDRKTAVRSAFDVAVLSGDVSLINLVQGGKPPSPKQLENYKAGDILRHQLRRGHVEMASWLVGQGLPINDNRQTLRTLLEIVDGKNDDAFAGLVAKAVKLSAPAKSASNEQTLMSIEKTETGFRMRRAPGEIKDTTALAEAARAGYALLVKKLIEDDARVNEADGDGNRALHAAAETNATEAAHILLDNGARIDATNFTGASALDTALENDAKDVACALAAKGARINPKYERAMHSLEAALRMDIPELVAPLLDAGFPSDGLLHAGWSLRWAAEYYQAGECLKLPRIQNASASNEVAVITIDPASSQMQFNVPSSEITGNGQGDPRNPLRIWPETKVKLKALVDKSGRAIFATVMPGEDGALPPHALQSAARKSLKTRKFPNTGTANGSAAYWITAIFRFSAMDKVDSFISEESDEGVIPIEPRARPIYPVKLLHDGKSGDVMLSFIVNKSGGVDQIDVIKATSGFERVSSDTVRRWRFKPAKKDGIPINVRMIIPIAFHP